MDEMSTNAMFFFVIIVVLCILLVTLLIVLFIKNKKLTSLINDMNKDKEATIVNDIVKEEPILRNENVNKENILVNEVAPQEEPIIEEKKEIVKVKKEEIGPYSKNVLREMSKKMPTSPIGIVKANDYEKENNISFDIREDMVSPLEEMEDNYTVNDNMKFASEIVEKMEKEIKPSNIELTDYEKKQEDEAIISYDELLKVKDKIYNITEDEETDEFIDELKNFRLDLQ